MKRQLAAILDLYVVGSRSMTWGRQLWWLILLKVVVLFVVLRAFFFRPTLAGKDEQQRIEYISNQLIDNQNSKNL